MSKDTAIYGLFNEANECLYVGRTNCPDGREYSHRRNKKFKEMRILKWVSNTESRKIEFDTILSYRRKGQALLNMQPPLDCTEFKYRPAITKSIPISEEVHNKVKIFCAERGIFIGAFIEKSIMNHIAGQDGNTRGCK